MAATFMSLYQPIPLPGNALLVGSSRYGAGCCASVEGLNNQPNLIDSYMILNATTGKILWTGDYTSAAPLVTGGAFTSRMPVASWG
jgi:hypothetical protein